MDDAQEIRHTISKPCTHGRTGHGRFPGPAHRPEHRFGADVFAFDNAATETAHSCVQQARPAEISRPQVDTAAGTSSVTSAGSFNGSVPNGHPRQVAAGHGRGHEIQYNLLPQAAPNFSGLDVRRGWPFTAMRPAGIISITCAWTRQDRQRLCIAVGDVSGHGLPSALLMATARGLLRQRVSMRGSLGEIVTDVNQRFAEDVERSGRFMTLFSARIDRARKKSSGCEPATTRPCCMIPQQTLLSSEGQRPALGSRCRNTVPRIVRHHRGRSNPFHCGTDGIWETGNEMGELFGKDRLKEVIRQHADQSARDILAGGAYCRRRIPW